MSGRPKHRQQSRRLVLFMSALGVVGCGGSPELARRPTQPAERLESIEPSASQPTAGPPAIVEQESKLTEAESLPPANEELDPAPEMEHPVVADLDPSALEVAEPETSLQEISAGGGEQVSISESVQDSEHFESGDDAVQMSQPSFRMFLPTTSGPLVVDAEIRVGDEPLQVAFDNRIRTVMEQARDRDSELTWSQLFTYVAADPQQFGRSASINSQQYKTVIRRYDRNNNKIPDHDEVARFLFRDSPFAGPFRLNGSAHYREINRSHSAVFAAIDRNGNRILEPDEVSRAADSISRLDQNADWRIDIDEVLSFSGDDNPAWKKRRSNRWGGVATDLSGFIDWSMLSYTIDDIQPVGPFGRTHNVVAKLDQDQSDTIDREEAKGLLTVKSDIILLIRYPLVATGAAEIEIKSVSKELDPLVQRVETANRIAIIGDALKLMAHVLDDTTGRRAIPVEAFAMLDVNNDGGLDEAEIPASALREYSFEELDQDDDGKLTLRELNEGMNPMSPIWNVQVRARGAESPDGVFAWLDQNQDQFLSSREVMAANDRLANIASPEGNVAPADIPDSYLIQFGRGDPNQDNQLFRLTPPMTTASDGRPRWAQSMDANRDGDISRLEFLGTSAQFTNLDANQDGFIDFDEIPAN